MSKKYLDDIEFLTLLDEMRIKEHFIKIQILDYKESPIEEVQGVVTAGNIAVNGSSAVRRTLSLTFTVDNKNNNLSSTTNIIAINKKIKVEIGLSNPFSQYQHYGQIIWFPLGTYIVTEANSSVSANSSTIQIKGKDKMCMLDGTCGGTLPATVIFHEAQIENSFGETEIQKIPIFTIIKECVQFYGKEIEQNIIINDIDFMAKQNIRYNGSSPIWFTDDYSSFIISEMAPSNENFLAHKFVYGQDIGYKETEFTFPGELIFEAGSVVTDVLDKIIQTLGNYEYFYDLEGRFIFQEKRNYLNNYYTPIIDLSDKFYIKAFNNTKYYQTLNNAKDTLSYHNNPKYSNIKNDFIVWGQKSNKDGVIRNIKYHLAIDEKPNIELASQYMWEVSNYQNKQQQHLYYFFESDEEQKYINVPEPKPIEVFFKKIDVPSEQMLNDKITEYIKTNYENYNSYENNFVIYLRVIWDNEIRYYQVFIENKTIKTINYLSEYTDFIVEQELAFAIYVNPEDGYVPEGDNILDWTDEVDPDMDTDLNFNGSTVPGQNIKPNLPNFPGFNPTIGRIAGAIPLFNNNNNNNIDEGFSKPSFYPNIKWPVEEDKDKDETDSEDSSGNNNNNNDNQKEKFYILLQINNQELGYYTINNEWKTVYTLKIGNQITLNDLKSIASQFKSMRVFINDIDSANDATIIINEINQKSGAFLSNANPKDIRYYENGQEKKIPIEAFIYSFEDIIKEEQIIFSSQEQYLMFSKSAEYYLQNYDNFISDLNMAIELASDEGYNNLLPWLDTVNPDMDTDQNYGDNSSIIPHNTEESEEIQFLIIDNNTGKLIYNYYNAIQSKDSTTFILTFLTDMLNYYYNTIINLTYLNNNFIYKVIVSEPEKYENFDYSSNFYYQLIAKPCYEWREELYRQALLNKESAGMVGYYDDELLAFWRENFDTLNTEWEKDWNEARHNKWEGWNPVIYTDPGVLNFWLDFIDSIDLLNTYSVNQIGRRSKVVSKESVNMLYKLEVPDVIFLENTKNADLLQKIEEYKISGQQYCVIKPSQNKYFVSSATGVTAFDLVREMLYSNLYYNISVNISCVPKYYLEPNNIIYINDINNNINGDFVITQYTLPLGYNGNMTINTNEVMVRV